MSCAYVPLLKRILGHLQQYFNFLKLIKSSIYKNRKTLYSIFKF